MPFILVQTTFFVKKGYKDGKQLFPTPGKPLDSENDVLNRLCRAADGEGHSKDIHEVESLAQIPPRLLANFWGAGPVVFVGFERSELGAFLAAHTESAVGESAKL